jgi:hypothetical protein
MNWRAIAGRSFCLRAVVGEFPDDVAAPFRRGKPAAPNHATVDDFRNPPETLPIISANADQAGDEFSPVFNESGLTMAVNPAAP